MQGVQTDLIEPWFAHTDVAPLCGVPMRASVTFYVFFSPVGYFCPDPCVQDGLVPNHHGPIHTLDACKIEEPDSNPQHKDANSTPPLSSLHVAAQYITIPTTRIIPNDENSTPEFPSIMGPKPMLAVQTGKSFLVSGRFGYWMILYEKRHQCTPMICRAMAKVLAYLICLSALSIFLCPTEDYMQARSGLRATNYRCHASLLYDDFNLAYT
jgi:hypothetical protein